MAYCKIMEMKKIYLLLITVTILGVSCSSTPPVTAQAGSQQPSSSANPAFDPKTISREQYDSTMVEVKRFIEDLNRTISNKNYNSWRTVLSQEYFNEISSQKFLNEMSEQPAMKTQKIVLKTPQDYFNYVVVPSRANSRADDIEFIDRNRVKVYTFNTNRQGEEQRLRLYDLEKIANSWKIIN
jgi:hypothetical protein